MDQPSGSKGGFDMASMSLASKLVLGGGVLLLIDSFLPWQKACVDFGALSGLTGVDSFCGKFNAWQGNAAFAGIIMGLLVLVLIGFEVASALSADISLSIPMSKLCAYLGFGVLGFAILKFLFSAFDHGALFAYVGLVLALLVGYGSWLHFQEPVTAASGGGAPPQTSI
jgi:hypothetical protein